MTAEELKKLALDYHAGERPGKISVNSTKPCSAADELHRNACILQPSLFQGFRQQLFSLPYKLAILMLVPLNLTHPVLQNQHTRIACPILGKPRLKRERHAALHVVMRRDALEVVCLDGDVQVMS